jgi:hypothetical protein
MRVFNGGLFRPHSNFLLFIYPHFPYSSLYL